MNISLGTWQSFPSDGYWTDSITDNSENLIAYAIKSGIRCFDTAQSYGNGRAEQMLGKILSRYDFDFVVDTKFMPTSKDVLSVLKTSEDRLKRKINCLYLHWPTTKMDYFSILTEMEKLKEKGFINQIGVCNLPYEDLVKVSSIVKLDKFQNPVSLLWTRNLEKYVSFCNDNKIEFVAYSPLGMGLLTKKHIDKNSLVDRRKEMFCYKDECYEAYKDLVNEIQSPAEALSWTRDSGISRILLGCRNIEQFEQNFSAIKNYNLKPERKTLLNAKAKALEESARNIINIYSYNY